MIKEFKTGKAEGLFVEVSNKTTRCIVNTNLKYCFTYSSRTGKQNDESIVIPKGDYQFLFTTLTATEEDAKKIVDDDIDLYPDCYESYIVGEPKGTATCFSAKASLRSLLQYVGLDTSKNYAVLIKVKQ